MIEAKSLVALQFKNKVKRKLPKFKIISVNQKIIFKAKDQFNNFLQNIN